MRLAGNIFVTIVQLEITQHIILFVQFVGVLLKINTTHQRRKNFSVKIAKKDI